MKINDAHGMGEHFAWHWLTIHPSLFGFLEYEIGELDESQGLFARVMESLGLERSPQNTTALVRQWPQTVEQAVGLQAVLDEARVRLPDVEGRPRRSTAQSIRASALRLGDHARHPFRIDGLAGVRCLRR